MELVNTFHFGHEGSEIAVPDKSHVVRFCLATCYSHATIIAQLSSAFNKAQLLHQDGFIDKPYHVSVLFPFPLDYKKKEADSETVFERIIWYINTMRIPDSGMTVSVYHCPEMVKHVTEAWSVNQFWPMRRQNKPKGEYITIQRMEYALGGNKKEWTFEHPPKYTKKVEEWADKLGIDIKYVDYTMPYQEMYEILLGSDAHFTYCGSTYYFAGTIGLKTYGLAPFFHKQVDMESYYDYDSGERIPIEVTKSYWGNLGTNKARIIQFDQERGVVLNKPPLYLKQIFDFPELYTELNKLERNFM